MKDKKEFEVIIVGGSYAGLSAALALGRSLTNVLIIDSGNPCNIQTPHAHNFITQDGETPAAIAAQARNQVLNYPTVSFINDKVTQARKRENLFEIKTEKEGGFTAGKLLFATGLTDVMPAVPGFAACWGISVLHCPNCHGYEVKNSKIGILGNGELGFEFARLIYNWSKDLVLFTNGKSTLTPEHTAKIKSHAITIVENEIQSLAHRQGQIQQVVFKNGPKLSISAMFARSTIKQHCEIPREMGCEMNEQGFIKVDEFYRTSLPGVYAGGDNTTMLRAIAVATAAGMGAGAFINKELIEENF